MNARTSLFLFLLLSLPCFILAQSFPFTNKNKGVMILYSREAPALDSIAAHLLASDIQLVTGMQPRVITNVANAKGNIIVIGNIVSPLVQQFIGRQSELSSALPGKWECFGWNVIDKPTNAISKALVIAGSDTRGTAYGVFTISEKLGVSPWYWWADVPVKKNREILLEQPEYISSTPSVKYRGIFINDEDWGLQPWASKTFEPETGDIGPKTYAKVFELLLRLKANLIWPAMHPSTKAFFYYPLNKKVAEDYNIVIGTSHAEPMLRNNVGEWDEKTMGHFNYMTNKEKVFEYWESRVKETTKNDVVYTMGMRGVHDSGIEGVKNSKEAVPLLEQIIKDQRDLLAKYRGKAVTEIPQVFTAYKEVLDIYDNGLKIPDDITLVWPDDNYGYIQRLNNDKERKRSGGAGVYYHTSYWGRPHDYLWLPSTHPGLIYEEMLKAWHAGADRLWVLNVGDIKPLEYNIDLFLKMAYEVNDSWEDREQVKYNLGSWLIPTYGIIGKRVLTEVLLSYFQLAFERRPEFMGWSRTEPTTQTTTTQYNHFYFGDEAQQRIAKYEKLERTVKWLWPKMKGQEAANFYQLVYYPVMCASWMNKKFLYRDKAIFYAKQNRLSASDYAAMSKAAYDSIVKETDYYNNLLAGGKWKNIMSMKPRDLPVFKPPVISGITIDSSEGWSIAPEGFVTKDSSLIDNTNGMELPAFDSLYKQRYFIDVFLSASKDVTWKAMPSHSWIRLSKSSGTLGVEPGKKEERIWVEIDWTQAAVNSSSAGSIVFKSGNKEMKVKLVLRQLNLLQLNKGEFVENNGYVSIHAANFSRHKTTDPYDQRIMSGVGYTGQLLQVYFTAAKDTILSTDAESIKKNNPYVEYDFQTITAAAPEVTVFTLPTHPLNNQFSMRYGVAVDDGPVTVVDFKTVGRSEEWKQNVLRNRAERTVQLSHLEKGGHKLRIYWIDPGVTLDEIRIDLGGLKKAYSSLPETIPADMRKKKVTPIHRY